MRFAGLRDAIALSGIGGYGGALLADTLAHDDMDRLAQQALDFNAALQSAPPQVSQAYVEVFGKGPMSRMDRVVAEAILDGTIDPSSRKGPVKADSPAGAAAIELAGQISQGNPALGSALAQLANRENNLFFREADRGLKSADVMNAVNQGAGVSPIPATAAGLLGGTLGALIASRAGRNRNRDPFQVARQNG